MGKLNEVQEQTTQSYGSNSFTTRIKENTVEFDSAKDKFTFLDPVEVPSINVNGQESVAFTSEDRVKLDNLQTPMQIKGRVDSVSELPTEGVKVGDTYLVGLSGSETFDEYVCVGLSGSPEVPTWESVGTTQVQSDWNQNDNTKADYVKNRTHYVETTSSTLFNDTFLYTEHQLNVSAGMVELSNPFQFEEGKQYTVTKDGVDYVLTAQIVDDTPSLMYGNFTELENGSWMMTVAEGDNFYVSECAETELSSTVLKIEVYSETVHTIDDKFISNNIARTADIPVVPTVAENILDGSSTGSVRSTNANTTIGTDSFSFGNNTQANGRYAVATGYYTTASADYSNAEGNQTKATGEDSHSEGMGSEASGMCSHSEGMYTIAKFKSQHVFGEFNVQDPNSGSIPFVRGNFVEIVGNGTSTSSRSNARTLDWSGNEQIAGTLRIGSTSTGGALLKFESNALKVSFDNGTTWLTISAS